MKKAVMAAALVVILPVLAQAETMYITDRIEASIRTGKGLAAGSQYLGVVRTGDVPSPVDQPPRRICSESSVLVEMQGHGAAAPWLAADQTGEPEQAPVPAVS